MTAKTNRHGWIQYAFSQGYYLPLMCIIVLCVASIFRFSHLGDKDFGFDEILHVYAAQELIQGNPPVLPSGYVYDRSISFSYLVGLAGFVGGFNEFALRVPSAIVGVLVVLLVYWLSARWFSSSAGIVAAVLTTFSPIEVALSREVRMYTVFQLLFLLIIFLFYEGFEAFSRQRVEKEKLSHLGRWIVDLQIRPLYLLFAGLIFLLAWEIHKLAQPGISGVLVYILVMGGVAILARKLDGSLRMKYIGVCCSLVAGAVAFSILFPEKIEEFNATMNAVSPWYQERSVNWNYYRWQLIDEYPIVFGSLTISLLVCFIKNLKLSLFLSLSLFVPIILHSLIFPQKSYRYIHHVLPIMYIIAGVGFGELFAYLWSAGLKLYTQVAVPKKIWGTFLVGVMGLAIVGMLVNMPWFMRTVKDFSTNFRSPHFADVQHHRWAKVMQYISQHEIPGDVIISSYPLLCSHYGAKQPLYFMNDAYLSNNIEANIRNEQGDLLDYTLGVIVLENLEAFKAIEKNNPSGWLVTYRWREEGYWRHANRPLPVLGSFPNEVLSYLQENYTLEPVPDAPDMAVWRWNRRPDAEAS